MSALNFSNGWARIPVPSVGNLDGLKVRKDGMVGVFHKMPDGRLKGTNIGPDGIVYEAWGRTKEECRRQLEEQRRS